MTAVSDQSLVPLLVHGPADVSSAGATGVDKKYQLQILNLLIAIHFTRGKL